MVGALYGVYEFHVATSKGGYGVAIGSGISRTSTLDGSVVLVDKALVANCTQLNGRLLEFRASEGAKTLAGCESVLVQMHEAGMKRGDTLIAIGGGALQDVATLCSSIYMRGVQWEYHPSTAMAMLDSCIGGKSSINVSGVKNLVGNIYPPKRVIVDVSYATSLSLGAKLCGLSEAVKICFADGKSLDAYLAIDLEPELFGIDTQKSEALVEVALRSKKWFVEIDEFDKKERLLLNFGHTFAHALESATAFRIPHGIAVAYGMLAALNHPGSRPSDRGEALREYILRMLRLVPDLTDQAREFDWQLFDRAIESDKKGTRDLFRLVLPTSSPVLSLVEIPRSRSALSVIRESMIAGINEAAS